jgi:hypothetical protein
MSPEQCSEARYLLKWSRRDLAATAGVPVELVAQFEDGELVGLMDCEVAMREALESVGIGFPFVDQFILCNVTYAVRQTGSRTGPRIWGVC